MSQLRETLLIAAVVCTALPAADAIATEESPFYSADSGAAADTVAAVGGPNAPATQGGTPPAVLEPTQPRYFAPVTNVYPETGSFGSGGWTGYWMWVQPLVPAAPVQIISVTPVYVPAGSPSLPGSGYSTPGAPLFDVAPTPIPPGEPVNDPWDGTFFTRDGDQPAKQQPPAVPGPPTSPVELLPPRVPPAAESVLESPFYQ